MLRWFILISLLCTNFAVAQAKPENWKFYGSFIYTPEIPKTLIFFDQIKPNARYGLRKALRNHDIENLVLSSRGGSVYEGLEMADIIHYRGINTFIPRYGVSGTGACASACAFMFLAGKNKRVDGQLGVHQFYSKDYKSMEQVSDTEEDAQFTVAEIIGFLNEYETPPFVYERMFQQKEMYYFDKTELNKIETNRDYFGSSFVRNVRYAFTEISKVEKNSKQTVQTQKKVVAPRKETKPTPAPKVVPDTSYTTRAPTLATIKKVQTELRRLGCRPGPIDGLIGAQTSQALNRLNKALNQSWQIQQIGNASFLRLIGGLSTGSGCKNTSPSVVTKKSNPVNKQYLRFKAAYNARKPAGSLGRIYAFRVVGNCNNKNIDEVWYGWRRMKMHSIPADFHYYLYSERTVDRDDLWLKPVKGYSSINDTDLFGIGLMKITRNSVNKFTAKGSGCKVTGKLIN